MLLNEENYSSSEIYAALNAGNDILTHLNRTQLASDLSLLGQLRTDIENNFDGFKIAYQPIYFVHRVKGCTNKRIVALEALIRWKEVSPSDFIPIAESCDLIHNISEWVLKQVIEEINLSKSINYDSKINHKYFINVSSALVSPKHAFLDMVKSVFEASSDALSRIGIELTESTVKENPECVKRLVTGLHEMGVEIALDDFGVGQSSLSRLRDLHVDKIKIDRSFTDIKHEKSLVILKNLLAMAHELGVMVVVEGIESEEQLERFMGMGFLFFQGFLLGKPSLSFLR